MQNATATKTITLGDLFSETQLKTAANNLPEQDRLSALSLEEFIDARVGAFPGKSSMGNPASSEAVAAEIKAALTEQRLTALACYGWQLGSPGFWEALSVNNKMIISPGAWEYFLAEMEPPTPFEPTGFSIGSDYNFKADDSDTVVLLVANGSR